MPCDTAAFVTRDVGVADDADAFHLQRLLDVLRRGLEGGGRNREEAIMRVAHGVPPEGL